MRSAGGGEVGQRTTSWVGVSSCAATGIFVSALEQTAVGEVAASGFSLAPRASERVASIPVLLDARSRRRHKRYQEQLAPGRPGAGSWSSLNRGRFKFQKKGFPELSVPGALPLLEVPLTLGTEGAGHGAMQSRSKHAARQERQAERCGRHRKSMDTNFLLHTAELGKVWIGPRARLKVLRSAFALSTVCVGCLQVKPCLFNSPEPGRCFGVPCTHSAENAREGVRPPCLQH